ncbi:MAG: tetratricopeptide repeat protein, partial [Planctomycetes bacterium]|nr:tetratricopeptide repeat protein [Planctomycetota bacterium]
MNTEAYFRARPLSVIALVTLLAFFNATRFGFVWEDQDRVRDNVALRSFTSVFVHFIPGRNPLDFKAYTPVAYVSYYGDHLLWNLVPAGCHLTNIVLHALNALLAYALARELFARRMPALIVGLLFGVQPIHTEAVTWIKNRAELVGGLFFLLSWLLFAKWLQRAAAPSPLHRYAWESCLSEKISRPMTNDEIPNDESAVRRTNDETRKGRSTSERANWPFGLRDSGFFRAWVLRHSSFRRGMASGCGYAALGFAPYVSALYALSILCFILSLLSKPAAMTLAAVLALHVLLFAPRQRFRLLLATAPFFMLVALYFVLIGRAAGQSEPGSPPLVARLSLVPATLCFYLRATVFPFNLSADHRLATEAGWSLATLKPALGLLALVGIAAVMRKSRLVAFSVLFFLLALVPVSNLKFLGARPLAEQRAYMPSLGYCLLFAAAVACRPKRASSQAVCVLAVVAAVALSAATAQRNFAWRTNFALWSDTSLKSPDYARPRHNLGELYFYLGRLRTAEQEYRHALRADPKSAISYANLGNVHAARREYALAIANYDKAIELKPDLAEFYTNMAVVHAEMGDAQ